MDSDSDVDEPQYQGVPGTIIMVNMFNPANLNTASVAQTAICHIIRQHMRDSSSQCIGVCLYGVEDSEDSSILQTKSVIDVFPLRPPTLDDYKSMKNLALSSIKQTTEFVMSDALLHCSRMFANCKKLLSSRNIVILSRLDVPPIITDQKPSLKRIEDLVDSGVYIQFINISETEYQIDPFYEDFILEANKGKDAVIPEPLWDAKEIEKIYQQSDRHLAVAKLNFEIGEGFNVGVGIYSLLKSPTSYKSSTVHRDTNALITKVNKTLKVTAPDSNMDEDSEEGTSKHVPLLKSELIHYQEIGGERIQFSDEEMKMLKNLCSPMIKLLGFKPASFVRKEKWYVKKGYFLFPNENLIEGSTIAFRALHQACVETGMMAVCALCTRVNSRPMHVALSPCSRPLGFNIDLGFDVICLPFVQHIRELVLEEDDDDDIMQFGEAHHEILTYMIKSMKFDYKPDMFENPKNQCRYRAIEALAELDMEPFMDTTQPPNYDHIKTDKFIEAFGNLMGAEKRSAPAASNGKAKVARTTEQVDENQLRTKIVNKQVDKYTVAELKSILKSKEISGLPALTGLKKPELVNLVYKHF